MSDAPSNSARGDAGDNRPETPRHAPGLEGVVAGETAVSNIVGQLRYRGYAIEDLVRHASFEETAYLLLRGELPTRAEAIDFSAELAQQARVAPEIIDTLRRLPASANMMDTLRSGVSLLAHFDPDASNNDHDATLRKASRVLAQLPIVLAARHRLRNGQQPLQGNFAGGFAHNLLWLLNGRDPTPRAVKALDTSLILYAEHEFNASTFTSRVVCSTQSDLHSALVGAIGALKGPLHGGANERVLEALDEVGSPAEAAAWVRAALDRKERVMGFGHRVYRQGDPRAELLRPLCQELARETVHEDLEEIAAAIEGEMERAKGLRPNLDWPSARLYYYLGLPVDLFTPLFVASRVAGWSAHVLEQQANNRLIRPLARYVGPPPRAWRPVGERG